MLCYVHTDRPARGACTACGEMICEECSVKLQNKRQCKPCVERGSHPSAMVQHGSGAMQMQSPSGQPMQMYGGSPGQPVIFNISGGSSSSASSASSGGPIVLVQKPFSHGLHLLITIFTAGLWLPVWILLAIFHKDTRRVA